MISAAKESGMIAALEAMGPVAEHEDENGRGLHL